MAQYQRIALLTILMAWHVSANAVTLNSRELNTSLVDSSLINSAAANLKKPTLQAGQAQRYPVTGEPLLINRLALELETRYSDNGNRSWTNEIKERQDEIDLHWQFGYQSKIVDVTSQYEWRNVHYDNNGQRDENYIVGDTTLVLNDQTGSFGVVAGHNQYRILTDMDQPETSNNREDRQVLFATPFARLRMTPADELQFSVDYRDTEYEIRHYRDYLQTTAAADYLHVLSPITGAAINVSRTEQSYKNNQLHDYDIVRGSLRVWRNLRKFQYEASLGVNRVDTVNGQENRPLYGAALSYNDPLFSLHLKYDTYITDVSESALYQMSQSFVDGNGLLDNLGSQSVNRDRINLRAVNYWISPTVQMILTWTYERDDFFAVDELVETNIYSMTLERRIRPLHRVYTTWSFVDRDAENNLYQQDYAYYRYELGYKYRFVKNSDITIYAADVGRSSANIRLYDEKIVGVTWYYQF